MAWTAMLVGCGYGLVHYEGALDGAEHVAIHTFENNSDDPGLELMMTDALRKEFLRRGAFKLVPNRAQADIFIDGIVVSAGTSVKSFSSVVLALEYNTKVSIDVFVKTRDGTPIPLSDSVFSAGEIYLASSDVQVQYKNRREALRWITSILASRVADALFLAEFGEKP